MFIERVICVFYLCWRELSCAAIKADKVSSVAYEDGGDRVNTIISSSDTTILGLPVKVSS